MICPIHVFPVQNTKEMKEAWKVREAVFVKEQNFSQKSELDGLDDLADHWIATCKTHGAVGTIRLLSYKEGVGKFGRLSVLDSHRGTGVAKALMQAMHEAVYDQAQYHTIICHAQLDKVAFYQSIGYQLLPGEAFYEGHVLHRKMMKTFKREKE
ncbi:MAG: acyl-CoA N-acyltransferase [Piptocephalis tieghemiana]|nr:MAG: acyl-CoA N-acyltransferase [Piptocephalis tieghemiana]